MTPVIFSLFFHYILQVVNDAAPYCAYLLMDGNQSLFKGLTVICHGQNYGIKSCIQMPFSVIQIVT